MLFWNIALEVGQRTIRGVEDEVATEKSILDRPDPPYLIESEDDYEKRYSAYEKKLAAWNEEQNKFKGAEAAAERAGKKIDAYQFAFYEFYWFIGLFWYAVLLSGVRGWFENRESQLQLEDEETKESSDDEESESAENEKNQSA